jgi:hypothetical protein
VLDAKALTVLSLDTVAKVGDGQATKILFPFEFSRLMEGAADYLGTSRGVPDRSLNTLEELEKRIGSMNDILGPIPKQEDLMTDIKSIEEELKAEGGDSPAIPAPHGARAGLAAPSLPGPEEIAPAPPSGSPRIRTPATTPSPADAAGGTRGFSVAPPVHRAAEPHGAPPSFDDEPVARDDDDDMPPPATRGRRVPPSPPDSSP